MTLQQVGVYGLIGGELSIYCKYLREDKDTGSGNGKKLVNLHMVTPYRDVKIPSSNVIYLQKKKVERVPA